MTVQSSYDHLCLSRHHPHATQVEARRFLTNKEECCTLERQGDHSSERVTYRGSIRHPQSKLVDHQSDYISRPYRLDYPKSRVAEYRVESY